MMAWGTSEDYETDMADISRGLNRQKFLHDLLRQWEAQTFESRSELRTMIDEKKDEMTQNIYSLFRKMFRGRRSPFLSTPPPRLG